MKKSGIRSMMLPGWLLLLMLVVPIIILLMSNNFSVREVWDVLSGASPSLIVVALAVHLLSFFFQGLRWRALAGSGEGVPPPPGLVYSIQLAILARFCNFIFWLRVGDMWRAFCYSRERRDSGSRVTGISAADAMYDLAFMFLILLVLLAFIWFQAPRAFGVILGLALMYLFLLGLGLVSIFLFRDLGQVICRRVPFLRSRSSWADTMGADFIKGVLAGRNRWHTCSLWTVMVWLCEICRVGLVIMAMGIAVPWALGGASALAGPALNLAPTPGGLGASESGSVWLFTRWDGISLSFAVALVLVDRAVSYLSVLILGGALLMGRLMFRSWRGGLEEKKADPADEPALEPGMGQSMKPGMEPVVSMSLLGGLEKSD